MATPMATDQLLDDRELFSELLEACEKGHYERASKKIVELEGRIDCTSIQNKWRQTLVHIAASNGHVKIVKLLLENKVDSSKLDKWNKTALMYACEYGHFRVAKVLLEVPETKDVINLRDKREWTALHLAASRGHSRIVQLLLNNGADGCMQAGESHSTPMRFACINGHVEVVKLLLKEDVKGSPVTYLARNEDGELITNNGNHEVISVLMDAINRELEDIAMAIMESVQVKQALEYKTIIDGKETTPLRLLFQKMPEVAERAFKYFTTQPKPENRGDDSCKFEISFDYEFLEDFVREKDEKSCRVSCGSESPQAAVKSDHQTPSETAPLITNAVAESREPLELSPAIESRESPELSPAIESRESPELSPTTKVESRDSPELSSTAELPPWNPTRYDKTNHCLSILIKSKSKILVRHPIVTTLLYLKWNRYARYFFIVAFLFHTLYAFLLTAFALITLQPMSIICLAARNYNNVTYCEAGNLGNSNAIIPVGVVIIIVAVLRLLFDGLYLIQLKLKYFKDWVNYLQILEFTGSIMFVFVFTTDCLCPFPWQWQIGAGCVFLAWIDLILFVRLIPAVGIYVVMLLKIFLNYLKVAVLGISLVLSFTFPLYMLFHEPRLHHTRTPFSNPIETFVKTLTMTTGGVDFDALFKQGSSYSEGSGVQYMGMSYVIIFLFLVLMTILLNNLLTGLAVDDVNEIRENATTKTLSLWVEFILQCEEMLLWLRILRSSKPTNSELKSNMKEFPNKFTSHMFWFKALQLDFFEVYDNKIIPENASKFNEKLMKKVDHLTAEMEKMKDVLDDLVMS